MIRLRSYQEELIAGIRAELASPSVRRVLAVLPTGGGKCLGRGTPVIRYDGTVVQVEDVAVGDLLMGPDSRPRRVVSLAHGSEMLYRVVPNKGDPYVVNESHILSLKMTPRETGDDRPVVNICVRDYLTSNKTFKHCAKGWRAPANFPACGELSVDPYMMGVWLGDGSSDHFTVTTGDPEICQELIAYAGVLGATYKVRNNSPGSVMISLRSKKNRGRAGGSPTALLKAEGVYGNKHIPRKYLCASREDRMHLLAGIIDSDGYYDGKQFSLTFKPERLMDDCLFLIRSLGFAAYKYKVRKTCTNNGVTGDYFQCAISGALDTIPCKLARHQAAPRRQKKDHMVTGISVEPVGVGEYFGFEIEGPDRLFLLGDFTVTHNTVCFSYIASRARERGKRIGIFAHRSELLDQISNTLRDFRVPHGVIGPGSLPDRRHTVFVCSAQTYARRAPQMPEFDLGIVDEAHHATDGSTWGKCIERSPNAKWIGVTATPQRLDGRGLGEMFDSMVIGPRPSELIEMGHLSKYRLFSPSTVDLSGVRMLGGDFNKGQAGEAVDKPAITGDIIEHYGKYLAGAPSAAFCVTVAHAHHVVEQFQAHGYKAAALDGKMDKFERQRIVRDFRNGALNIITSAELLSEGFDVPGMYGAILIRPTKSLSLYLQQVGRALRTAPGKDKATILDHVGNSHDDAHGLPCADRDWSLEGRSGARAPSDASMSRECGKCYARVPLSRSSCPECGTVFPVRVRELEQVDGSLAEQDIEERRAAAPKKEESPERRAQRQTRTREGLVDLFRRQMADKLGRPLTDDEMAAQERRAGYVLDARRRKSA